MQNKLFGLSGIFILFLIGFILFSGGRKVSEVVYKQSTLETKDKGPDLYPSEWAWNQRTFPYFKADPAAHLEAIKQAQLMRETQRNKLNKTSDIPAWQFAGPANIGGRIADIEFDPADHMIVYAAASTGGVFKSTDRGQTWFPIFDEQAILPAGDIAVDPVNSNIIYVGTGEPNGSHNNQPGGGVFKSTDSGQTWRQIGLDSTSQIGRILVDPSNPQRVFVAAVGSNFAPNPERGIYRSTDGGETWQNVLFVSDTTGAIDIVMDPVTPSFLLAAMWQRVRHPGFSQSESSFGPTGGIFRSTDGGDNWEKLGPNQGLPDDNSGVGRIGLAISKSNPAISFALYNDGGTYSGLYKTTNHGDTWVKKDLQNQISDGTSSFSWYFGQVRIHPANPDTVIVLDVAFMRSVDDGNNWPLIYGYGGPNALHVDHHALAFDPADPNYLISGNDGGMNISTDCGQTWSSHVNIPVTQFYEIGLDFNKPERLYGGTQDNNTIRTTTGSTNDWQAILGGDGFYVIVDFTNSNIIYAESQFGNLAKTTNGSTFFNATNGINPSEPTNWSTPVVMDPNDHNVLYYGTNRLYRTTDGAQNWSPISGNLALNSPITPRYGTLTTIAVAPTNSNVIYAGTDDSKVWVTSDLGSSWTDISADLPFRWVTRVVVDPNDENIVYTTFSGLKWRDPQPHVFRSTDMGQSWTDISSNLPDAPVNAFAVDFNNSSILYLGNDVGVFVSFNTGQSWEVLGTGMPVISVYDLKIHPDVNYLAAGTFGRSMYKLDLDQITGIENSNTSSPKQFELFANYPNPFNPSTTIKFRQDSPGNVSLKIFDMLGREVSELFAGDLSSGIHSFVWNGKDNNGNNLASGTYIYSVQADKFNAARKMILLK